MNNVLKIKDSSGNWIGIPAIRGEKGDKGENGTNGKSAYETACEGGFTGTEEEFANLLANPGMGGGALGESKTFPWAFGDQSGKNVVSDDATYYTIPLADGKILVQCCTPSLTSADSGLSIMTSDLPFTPIGHVFHLPFGYYAAMVFLEMEFTDDGRYHSKSLQQWYYNSVDYTLERRSISVDYIPPLQFSYVAVPPTSEVN